VQERRDKNPPKVCFRHLKSKHRAVRGEAREKSPAPAIPPVRGVCVSWCPPGPGSSCGLKKFPVGGVARGRLPAPAAGRPLRPRNGLWFGSRPPGEAWDPPWLSLVFQSFFSAETGFRFNTRGGGGRRSQHNPCRSRRGPALLRPPPASCGPGPCNSRVKPKKKAEETGKMGMHRPAFLGAPVLGGFDPLLLITYFAEKGPTKPVDVAFGLRRATLWPPFPGSPSFGDGGENHQKRPNGVGGPIPSVRQGFEKRTFPEIRFRPQFAWPRSPENTLGKRQRRVTATGHGRPEPNIFFRKIPTQSHDRRAGTKDVQTASLSFRPNKGEWGSFPASPWSLPSIGLSTYERKKEYS